MEIVILVLTAVNTALICWFGKQLLSREEYRVEFVPIPSQGFIYSTEELASQSEQKEVPQPEAPAQAQEIRAKVSYTAWENRTNIPWVESNRPVATPPVSLKKEPLAPHGFV